MRGSDVRDRIMVFVVFGRADIEVFRIPVKSIRNLEAGDFLSIFFLSPAIVGASMVL